jgi:hypothetical protein
MITHTHDYRSSRHLHSKLAQGSQLRSSQGKLPYCFEVTVPLMKDEEHAAAEHYGAFNNIATHETHSQHRPGHRLHTMTIHITKIFNVTITIILIASFAIAYSFLFWAAFTE